MTQDILLEWVKAHGCTVTHKKKNFYRVVNSEGQAMGIPQPRAGSIDLLPMTVVRICCKLKVPVPDYAKEAYQEYSEIQKNHHDREID
jgi:hypothetical protein